MCVHEYYHSKACGHKFPRLPPSVRSKAPYTFNDYHRTINVPSSRACVPVKLALKFYHDQLVYLNTELVKREPPLAMPKLCPTIHTPRDSVKKRSHREREHHRHLAELSHQMRLNLLTFEQEQEVERHSMVLDQCSNRLKQWFLYDDFLEDHMKLPFPQNMYLHIQSVKKFQSRKKDYMLQNVTYFRVDFGCGGPFSPQCLVGWNGLELLTNRLHVWADAETHPHPCSMECLPGWAGPQIDRYRKTTWADNWEDAGSPEPDHTDLFEFNEDGVLLDYTNIKHRHLNQYEKWGQNHLNNVWYEQKYWPPTFEYIRHKVWVRVPRRLRQTLYEMSRMNLSGLPRSDEAQYPIEELLRRVPEFSDKRPVVVGDDRQPLTWKRSKSLMAPVIYVDDSHSPQLWSGSRIWATLPHVAARTIDNYTMLKELQEAQLQKQQPRSAPTNLAILREAESRRRRQVRTLQSRSFSFQPSSPKPC